MGEIRFSVIVPLYNKARYIERTLNSVMSQTFTDYELVVVDDGSTDNSVEVVERLIGAQEPKCRLVRQANAGVARARNSGVAMSRGRYVCFLDSDDWWEPSFLEEMDHLINQCPEAGLYGTGLFLVKNGKKRIAPIGVDEDFVSGYINYCQVYAKTLCMPISSSSVAIPRDIFKQSGQFRSGITLGEDFDLWIRIALKHKVALVNKPLANYFQDVPVKHRATRKLRPPSQHFLWNIDYLAAEEKTDSDLKCLLDRMRVNGLYRFYLSSQYREEALVQLAKVDWDNVSVKQYKIYHSSRMRQKVKFAVRSWLSATKQLLYNTAKK